jgi:CubicO group peptidase (beta-lactamase class C family)
MWADERLLPEGWVQAATTPSQDGNRGYGYAYWTNRDRAYQPAMPEDLFAFSGYAGNRCFVIPSLDLVVARVGSGPSLLDDRNFLEGIVGAVL